LFIEELKVKRGYLKSQKKIKNEQEVLNLILRKKKAPKPVFLDKDMIVFTYLGLGHPFQLKSQLNRRRGHVNGHRIFQMALINSFSFFFS